MIRDISFNLTRLCLYVTDWIMWRTGYSCDIDLDFGADIYNGPIPEQWNLGLEAVIAYKWN